MKKIKCRYIKILLSGSLVIEPSGQNKRIKGAPPE
jgi:hypothetical protein